MLTFYRTGRVYHGLGNVLCSLEKYDEGEQYHRKAVAQWQSTIGENHHKTADGYIRVARHCMRRMDQLDEAASLIEKALSIYQRRPEVYKPQIARTLFTKAQLLMANGAEQESVVVLKQAAALRNQLSWTSNKTEREVRESDFDELVILWSR